MQEDEMKIYDCYVKPIHYEFNGIVPFNHLKFIGFDFIVDSADGVTYLLEGNATPYGLQLYQELYDFSLARALQRMVVDKGKLGINLDLDIIRDLSSHKNRYTNTKYIADLLEEIGVSYLTFSDNEVTKGADNWQAKGKDFDIFWNRCFGIPESYKRLSLDKHVKGLLPTGPCIRLMADKWETKKRVMGIVPTPCTIRVDSQEEEFAAFEEISAYVKKKYDSKVTQKVIIKPIYDTGGNGIQFVDRVEDIKDHAYPSLVQERIIPELYDGRVVDLRIFFVNGWIAKPIARVAPERFNNSKVPLERKLLTALCSGGTGIRVSEKVAERVADYVMATSIELERSLNGNYQKS